MDTAPRQSLAARTLEITIPVYEGDKQIGFVRPTPAPESRIGLADFIGNFFSEQPIEHLARSTMVNATRSRLGYSAHSLFFQAVHACYDSHYPLALRPEVLAYLINHEIAVTVNKYPDDYRHLFTNSPKRTTIKVRNDRLLLTKNPAYEWERTLGMFEAALRRYVPVGCMDLMMPGFTTDTPESRTATLVAFMDTVKSFYDFFGCSLCGIPRIRLDGTAEDYRKLSGIAEQLAGIFAKHLGLYFEHLLPVLRKIAEQAASSETDHDFWSKIYSHSRMSGRRAASGWITAFLAYVREDGELVPKTQRLFDWISLREHDGIPYDDFPTHVSSVPFRWRRPADEIPMRFVGGVLAVENDGGFISPQLSYGVIRNI